MSLKDCIAKAGPAITEEDAAFLEQELADGKTDAQAIKNLRRVINAEIKRLTARIEKAGGEIAKEIPRNRQAVADMTSLESSLEMAMSDVYQTNKQLKEAMQAQVEDQGFDLVARSLENENHLVKQGVRDAVHALKSNSDAVGWYDLKISQAIEVLATIHPEIKTDPQAKFAFTYALAVTSNGLKVDKNFELAEKAYQSWKKTGKFTAVGIGNAKKAINNHLKLFNQMSQQWSIEDFNTFMTTSFSVNQIKRMGFKITGELGDTQVTGAAILGPKIGNGFFSNLNGKFEQLTMDRWLMRTWGRWTGSLLVERPDLVQAKSAEMHELVRKLERMPKVKAEFEKLLGVKIKGKTPADLAVRIQRSSMDPDNRKIMNRTSTGSQLRLAGNGLAKDLDGQKEAPQNGAERQFIRQVFDRVLGQMRDMGYNDMTMADLQALLWYPEKRLYDIAKLKDKSKAQEGYDPDEAPDYANAAKGLAKARGVETRKITAALKRGEKKHANNVSARRARDGVRSEADLAGADALDTGRERQDFLRRNILVASRVNRSGKPGTRTYKKGKRGAAGDLRGLVHEPNANYIKELGEAEVDPVTMVELESTPESAQQFHDLIQASKEASEWGAVTHLYTPAEYAKMRLFISDDKTAGFAIMKDGTVTNITSTGGGKAYPMLSLAVEQGAKKLTTYDTALPKIYEMAGFKESGREVWDEKKKPKGWNKRHFRKFNDGHPDVVTMKFSARHIPAFYSQGQPPLYHGSGVSGIEYLSTDYINTGEGAQYFGWGIYLTESKEIARWYRNTVGGGTKLLADGVEISLVGRSGAAIDWEALRAMQDYDHDGVIDENEAMQEMKREDIAQLEAMIEEAEAALEEARMFFEDPDVQAEFAKIFDEKAELDRKLEVENMHMTDLVKMGELLEEIYMRDVEVTDAGGVYALEIAPTDNEMLHWGKMLRDQDPRVRDAISKALGREVGSFATTTTGEDLYMMLAGDLKSDRKASEMLHGMGVRGIKFAAGTVFGLDSDRFNYVIFADEDMGPLTQLEQKKEPSEAMIAHYKDRADKTGDRTSRVQMEHKDVLKRVLVLQEAAQNLQAGKITANQYNDLVNKHKPIGAYESVPVPAKTEDMEKALHSNKLKNLNQPVEDGHQVGLRLDIPAYKDHNVWVPTIHENETGKGKGPISHMPFAVVTGAVFPEDTHAIKVAAGGNKAPSAVIKGAWKNQTEEQTISEARAALNDPSWVQVGFDPERHSYFFDRSSTMPVVGGEKVIQVGGLVLVKNPTFGKKGDFQFQPDRARYFPNLDGNRVTQLLESSDLSSFLHESGHLFLDMQRVWAAKYGLNDNQRAMLKWLGVASFDDVTTEMHERWAETFEVYLREGKAPSLGLRRAFSSFARWLKRIYTTLKDPRIGRAQLSPEITDIFDRLLATQEEIDIAAATPEYTQLFESIESAGMTTLQWAEYQRRVDRQKETAEMTLDEKVLKQYKQQKSEEWADEKAPLIEQERDRLAEEPVYRLISETQEDGKHIDWHKLKKETGVDLPGGKLKAAGGGVDPGLYAEKYGFSSVKDMYQKVSEAPSLKDAADQAAESIMVKRHGDILNDGTLEEEVREAMLNEDQAQILLMEMQASKKKEGWMGDLGMPPQAKLNREYLKAQSAILIGKMKFKQIRPNKYYNAMIKAAKAAAAGVDVTQNKITQLANHYLYKQAMETKDRMTKNRKKVAGVASRQYDPTKVNEKYIGAMKNLALAYDMRLKPKQRAKKLAAVLDHYAGQLNPDNPYADLINLELLDPNLIEAIRYRVTEGTLEGFQLKTFQDLTADELQGVVDMLEHLRYVGGHIEDLKQLKKTANKEAGVAAILEEGGKDAKVQRGVQIPLRDARITWADMVGAITGMANMIRKLDGFKPGGWAFENILKPLSAAVDRKFELQQQLYEQIETFMGDISNVGLSLSDAMPFTKENGTTQDFSSEEVFMMAVYWGTETSREAIMEGHGMTEADVKQLLTRLTPEQLNLVNGIWAMNESQWPELQKAAKAMLGIAPPKLQATPFVVNGVQMTGGHMQLMYDSVVVELKDEQERGMNTSNVVPMRAGSTHQRVGSGGKPVRLLVANVPQSLEEKTHYIAFAEVGRDLRAIINNPDISAAIEQKHGPAFYDNLVHAVSSISRADPAKETARGLARISRWARASATMMHLAYSIRNVMQQFPAALISMRAVGPIKFAQASGMLISQPSKTIQMVNEKSKFMENRAQVVNREAKEYLKKVVATSKGEKMWEGFKAKGFIMQTMVDMTVAYPTWYAQYNTSIEEHGDEARAVIEADTAVAESVGSGSDMHLGRVMQSNQNEFVKTLTVFGSWFNAYYQRLYKSSKAGSDFTNMAFFMDGILLPFIVANLTQMIIFDTPDEDEEWYEYAWKNTWRFMVGTLPLVRDFGSLAEGFAPTSPISAIPASAFRAYSEVKSYAKGNQTGLKTVADIGKAATSVVKAPGSGNLWRSLDYIDSYLEGDEGKYFNPYQMLAEGSDKNVK